MTHSFEQWIKDNHDEYLALRAFFGTPYKDRPTLKDLKELAAALEAPPLFLTTERLWRAYEHIRTDKVKGHGKLATDLVSLIRFAVGKDDELTPHADAVTGRRSRSMADKLRFDIWLSEQEQNGKKFNATQRGWLMMVRDHIATSLSIEPEDFDLDSRI
jgi:type I restriction enzyme, R subunit